MINNEIVFKGTKDGLYIILKEESNIDEIKEKLEMKLKPSKKFFEGAKIKSFIGKKISKEEFSELKSIVETRYGMEVQGAYDSMPIGGLFETEEKDKKFIDALAPVHGKKESGLFIRGTIRSGQLIKCNENITIVGDVNPGAHLEATGSIIIMGTMRGTAHAGFSGNYDAYIAAVKLEPMQLRIGDIIARSPDGKQYKSSVPEIAIVRCGMIVIEPC
ncbi:MAG: septum site-determining protein MinC [Clostridiales bacterium]|nr:septum site-determining protein MinC [Clostridiales bacterium]